MAWREGEDRGCWMDFGEDWAVAWDSWFWLWCWLSAMLTPVSLSPRVRDNVSQVGSCIGDHEELQKLGVRWNMALSKWSAL